MSIELKIREETRLADGLSIVLNSFSHKQPYPGGPTKATAHLSITRGNVSEEIKLSVHGIQGKTTAEDGLSDTARYERKRWQEYEFHLLGFEYDRSITIKIGTVK